MRGGAASLSLVLFVTFASARADAGCPTVCELGPPSVAVTPAIACADSRIVPSTCDCAAFLQIDSRCAMAVNATDFQFDSCWLLDDRTNARSPCTSVQTGERGIMKLGIEGNGHKDWSLHVGDADGEHVVQVAVDVTSFSTPGCAFSVRGASRRERWGMFFLALSLAFAFRRSRGAAAAWRP